MQFAISQAGVNIKFEWLYQIYMMIIMSFSVQYVRILKSDDRTLSFFNHI